MKKILSLLFAVALSVATVFAQAPEKMNYQGVARDNSGNVLPNQAVGLQVKLHSGTSSGPVVYSETFSLSTNAFGLFNVQIGTGSNVTGTFSTISWATNAFYVEVLLDATGGTTYVSMGTQQLVSVPYALNAKSAATTTAVNGTTNYVSKFTAANTIGNSSIFDNGLVGIGTSSPTQQLHIFGSSDPLLLLDGPAASQSVLGFATENTNKWAFYIPDGLADLGLWNWQTYNNAIMFNGTNNDVLIAPDAGNIGVGTSTPSQKFHISAASGNVAAKISTGGSVSSLLLDNTGVTKGFELSNWNGLLEVGYRTDLTTFGGADYLTDYDPVASPQTFEPFNNNDINLGNNSYKWAAVYAVNGTIQTSDMRYKDNVETINYGLNTVMNLKPISYQWKNNHENGTHLGFSAQELEKLVPEVVEHTVLSAEDVARYTAAGKKVEYNDSYGVKYSELIPVLTKAVQEQQQIIDDLKARIEKLEAK